MTFSLPFLRTTPESLVRRMPDLPPAPRVLHRLQSLLAEEEVGLEQIATLVQLEPGLSAKVVRMANSVAVFVGSAKDWLPELVEKSKAMKVGPGTDRSADLGPLVNAKARERVLNLIGSGVEQGATLLLDGRQCVVKGYEKGNFVGPTVFSDVTEKMDIYNQEIFGPVLNVVCVETLEEAIAFINRNPNGNGTSIFTSSGWSARKFQHDINVGQVGINVPIPVPVAYFSFTGSRASKLGDLGPNGKQAVQFWTQTKTVTARWYEEGSKAEGVNTTITMK